MTDGRESFTFRIDVQRLVETFLGDLPLDVKVWNGLLINKGTVSIPTHEKNKLYQVFHVLCVF
jgi:hypothetical protein